MESPYKEIVIFVFGGGLIGALIQVAKELRERVAEKKKQKAAEAERQLTGTVELQRLENESDDAAWKRLSEMLEQTKKENERLELQAERIRSASSLSDATKTEWYKCYRELGTKIDRIENQITREAPHSLLGNYLEDLKNKYDELGKKMP